ncbi:MAG TPA: primosomal protein N', partial [Candidatus Acidoferrales bacterium]|nr:primosomal protein N' [Candidatus Acidoferrales bacterium]
FMRELCEVALPVPLRTAFTYAAPESLAFPPLCGARVVVPFRKRAMVGVVLARTSDGASRDGIREIVEVLDQEPALSPALIALGRWVANYYLAPVGEVFRAMLPPVVEVRAVREVSRTAAGVEYLRELEGLEERTGDERAEAAVLREFGEGEGAGALRAARLRRLDGGEAAMSRLLRRGALEAREAARPARRRGGMEFAVEAPGERAAGTARHTLNAEQTRALDAVRADLAAAEFRVNLLHGVTGSGKTEVYLGAIEAALAAGRTALVLVPEIALTMALSRLLDTRLGREAGVTVLHSALPDAERSAAWWAVRRGAARVVVGTRSAVFAPLQRLGLIVVDEEQEAAYKQEETPKYNGRDAALVRAKLEGAVGVLGSATPSLESYQNARRGKYRLLELPTRVEDRPMARVELVDLREDFQRTHKTRALGERLRGAIAERLEAGTQSLILINRRGYSWFMLCRGCGASVQCRDCSIALTYHKRRGALLCHYCGFSRAVPVLCPKCSGKFLYYVGEGAEQVEEQLRAEFPRARIGRLDRDSVRTPQAYRKILQAFATGELDLLVGTQMLAKGHDFHRVTLVGVVSADLALGLPDFRAAERTFQLLTQVAGRAGRGELPGEVLIQTHYPEHYSIQFGARQDYHAFFEREAQFRRAMHYPPFAALANVIVRAAKLEDAARWARQLAGILAPEEERGLKVLGPAAAPLARLRGEHRLQFLIKSPRRSLLTAALTRALDACGEKEIPDGAVLVDVDPMGLM